MTTQAPSGIRHGRMFAVIIGVAACLLTLILFFPLGCFESDGGAGTVGRQRGECPGNLTRIGFEWPNSASGLAGSVLLSLIVGGGVGAIAWRRWADTARRRSEALDW